MSMGNLSREMHHRDPEIIQAAVSDVASEVLLTIVEESKTTGVATDQ
jgi:hypothetical protein